jgi:hypothetical protein
MQKMRCRMKEVLIGKSNSVVGLVTGDDGNIYGGVTGEDRLFFRYNPKLDAIEDLGLVAPGHHKLHHGIGKGPDGKIYLGTGHRYGDADPHYVYLDYEGSRLIEYDPVSGALQDFGVRIPNEGTFCMAVDARRGRVYGVTYPSNRFWTFDLDSRRGEDKGHIGPMLSHSIAVDPQGNVWGSYGQSRLFKYDLAEDRVIKTTVRMPGDEQNLDSIVLAPNGMLYGGTGDWFRSGYEQGGYVFVLDPKEGRTRYLGKPAVEGRIPAMALGRDGKTIYGCTGSTEASAFALDTEKETITNLGFILVPWEEMPAQARAKRPTGPAVGAGDERRRARQSRESDRLQGHIGFRIHMMDVGLDGTLYCGETDRDPYLYICTVER